MSLSTLSSRVEEQSSDRHEHDVSTIISTIERLKTVLSEEVADIRAKVRVDYDGYNLKKNRAFLELNRASQGMAKHRLSPRLGAAITELRVALEENERELRVQLAAARCVSNLISQAIRDAQSDGTYSALSWWGSSA